MLENAEEFQAQEAEVIQGEVTDVAVIASRLITVVSTRGEKVKIIFSGDTWGELKSFLSNSGKDVNGNRFSAFTFTNMKCVESLTRHTLEHPTAILPKENFVLFMMLQKSKSGVGAERVALLQEVRDVIANAPDVDQAKAHFNKDKNFTNKSSEEIQNLLFKFGKRSKSKSQPGYVRPPKEPGVKASPTKAEKEMRRGKSISEADLPDMENEMQKAAKPNVADVVQSVQMADRILDSHNKEKKLSVSEMEEKLAKVPLEVTHPDQDYQRQVIALLTDIRNMIFSNIGIPIVREPRIINEKLGEMENKRQEQEAEEKRMKEQAEEKIREEKRLENERLRLEQEEKEKEEKRKKREEEKENAQLVGEFESVMEGLDDVRHENVRSTFGNPILGDDDDDDDDEEDNEDY